MSRLNDIEKLRGWCHKVLPLVYDDSLSYYEVLCKVRAKINEVIDLTAEQNDIIEEALQEITNWETTTDNKYDEFEQRMTTLFNNFVQTTIQNFEQYQTEMNTEYSTFTTNMNSDFNKIKMDIVNNFDRNREYFVGQYCYAGDRNMFLYRCMYNPGTSLPPHDFDYYTWEQVDGAQLYGGMMNLVVYDNKTWKEATDAEIARRFGSLALYYSNLETYNVGDIRWVYASTSPMIAPYYDLYVCTTQVSEPEDFDPTKWEVITLADYMNDRYEQFLEDYQRQFGVVQVTGTSTTDVISQKGVTDLVNTTIEKIEQGTVKAGYADVADNLTAYSEDSGVTQEEPFISQGTGTDNNTVIVTTGAIARQLEKQGNTIPVIQLLKNGNFTDTSEWTSAGSGTFTVANNIGTLANVGSFYISQAMPDIVAGHMYYVHIKYKLVGNGSRRIIILGDTTSLTVETNNFVTLAKVITASTDNAFTISNDGLNLETQIASAWCFDITGWDSSIVTDLTSNPEHFSWYYNGSLAYNAGSLQDCNGRHLECGQDRNLFDQQWEVGTINDYTGQNENANDIIRCNGYVLVIPNNSIYFFCGSSNGSNGVGFFYDNDFNFISALGIDTGDIISVPSNARYFRFRMASDYGSTYTNDISIEIYYTPEQGGEGYGTFHPYVAPTRIDTGTEVLNSAGDVYDFKVPSGLITRNVVNTTIGALSNWQVILNWQNTGHNVFYTNHNDAQSSTNKITTSCAEYVGVTIDDALNHNKVMFINEYSGGLTKDIAIIDDDYSTVEAFLTAKGSVSFNYGLDDEHKTTEQGTPFSEYADINDYSYMAWFDTDENLVSIPQGCKLFYPVDYKGFIDDGVMYTNGVFTSLAKNEDITDSALAERGYNKTQYLMGVFAVKENAGGILRHMLVNQVVAGGGTLDFANTKWLDLGDLNWSLGGSGGNKRFQAVVTGMNMKPASSESTTANILCSIYVSASNNSTYAGTTNMTISINSAEDPYVGVVNTTYNDATDFKNAMKGILLAFETN